MIVTARRGAHRDVPCYYDGVTSCYHGAPHYFYGVARY